MPNAFDPNDIYNKSVGTTQLPDSLETSKVATRQIQFSDGSKLERVEQDHKSNQYKSVPSSYALFQGLAETQRNIDKIDPNHNFFRDNTVITLSLVDSHFQTSGDNGWQIKNWTVVDESAVYTSGLDTEDNYLRITQRCFVLAGFYHLNITTTRIDSGSIRIYDHANQLVGTIDKVGETNFEMYIAEPNITTLRFEAHGVYVGDYINIEQVGVHLVKDRFRDYFINKLQLAGVGREVVDRDQCVEIATTVAEALDLAIRNMIVTVSQRLTIHESTKGNAHGLTLEDLSAAAKDHTHPEFAAFGGDLTKLFAHIGDTESNPHGITPKMIRAMPEDKLFDDRYAKFEDLSKLDMKYVNMEQWNTVPALIDAAIADSTGEGGESTVPLVIRSVSGVGLLPPSADKVDIDYPCTLLLQAYLLHMSTTDYDYYTGLASSTRKVLNGSAGYAFSDYHGKAATFLADSATDETYLSYRFHAARKISGYTIYKDPEGDANGFPVSWSLLGKADTVIDTRTNSSWSTAQPTARTDSVSYPLSEPVSTNEITLKIDKLTLDSSKKWGVRISFVYADVDNANTVHVNTPLVVSYLDKANVTVGDSEAKLTINQLPEQDSPLVLFLRKKSEIDQTSGKFVLKHELVGDMVESTEGTIRVGYPSLMDKYVGVASHNWWGTITSNNVASPDFAVRNVYNTSEDYYKSSTASLVEITHDSSVVPLSGMTGFDLRWDKALVDANLIPKSIRVTMTGTYTEASTGNNVVGTKVVLDIPEYRIPIREDGPDHQIINFRQFKEDQFSNITKIKLELNYNGNRAGQTAVGLSQFVLFVRGWWINPGTLECSNADRFPFGRLERVALPTQSKLTTALRHVACPMSKVCRLPVEHFNKLPAGVYTVPNPFNSTRIGVELFSTQPETSPLCHVVDTSSTTTDQVFDAAIVTSVTPANITVTVEKVGRYGVKVSRLW